MSKKVTVVLGNYKRTKNTHRQLEDLAKTNVKVIVWNNNPDVFFESDKADWVINSSKNVHGYPLNLLYQMVNTEYICRMDDDITIRDFDIFKYLGDIYDNNILSPYGVILNGGNYKESEHVGYSDDFGIKKVDVCKGIFTFFSKKIVEGLGVVSDHHFDLHFSFHAAKGKRLQHKVDLSLKDRLENLSEKYDDLSGSGYSNEPNHYQERDIICKKWLKSLN